MQIDQPNDTFVSVNGNEGSENAGRCESPLSFSGCNNRAQLELVQIASLMLVEDHHQRAGVIPHLHLRSLSADFLLEHKRWRSYDGVENMR